MKKCCSRIKNYNKMMPYKKVSLIVGIMFLIVLVFCFLSLKYSEQGKKEKIENLISESWNKDMYEEKQSDYLEKISNYAEYTIKEIRKENGAIIVYVTVVAPDLGAKLKNMDYLEFPQTSSFDELEKFLCEQIDKSEIVETQAEIYIIDIDGECEISFSEKFVDAMSGKVYEYAQLRMIELLQEFREDGEK